MARKPKAKTRKDPGTRILEAALEIAEAGGWGDLRLRDVAAKAGVTLPELRRYYRDVDAIADAWFRTGLDAMLAPVPRGFYRRPAKDRIEIMMLRWFDALGPRRRTTAEMLEAKLWLFHPHHYVPMVFNLSRLIQWLRDVAGLDASGRRRQIEEIGLTALFLATLAVWCRDDGDGQARTRAYLARRLDRADAWMGKVFPTSP
ncbi:MAG: TetR/AcrR family transcriptional regulator [Rhodospirillales bacterium]